MAALMSQVHKTQTKSVKIEFYIKAIFIKLLPKYQHNIFYEDDFCNCYQMALFLSIGIKC